MLGVGASRCARWRDTRRAARIEAAAVAELQRLREVEKQYNRAVREEHEILKKAIRFCRTKGGSLRLHLQANREAHSVQMMCRAAWGEAEAASLLLWGAPQAELIESTGDAHIIEPSALLFPVCWQ